ncbi:AMP-binding protein [Blattabacterium cuenoti]|uniref:AMP-binding protein n=1 Tax=Blattabacterium cuenoti TaxID=1653831 RepID=UPI00163BFE3E|nr:AMP-binding protein [Blattabacterium cuenoti]
MENKKSHLGIWIDFSSKNIFTNLISSDHPLFFLQKSIFSFLKSWYDCSPVLIGFTSGTTGIPKKIFLNKKYMIACAKMTVDFLDLKKNGILGLLCLSIDYIATKMFLVRAIIFKWNVYCILPSSNPLKDIKESFDISSMVPIQVYSSLKKLKREKIKILLIGGAPISIDLEKKLQNISTLCYSTYGMTETLGHIALKKINGLDKTNYYQSFKDVHLSVDKRNCLKIFSPYHRSNNNIILDSDSFIQTNDIVHMISKHKFNWVGRYDNMINSGGIKVIPELIEKEIFPFIPFHKLFFVSSIPDKKLGDKIVLVIESKPFNFKIPESIFVGKKKFYKPKHIFFVERFSKNSFEKFNRKKIINELIQKKN